MDTISSAAPTINAGHTKAQVFFGQGSHIVHIKPISRTKSLIQAFQSFVCKWGAPNRLLSNHAGNHTSAKLTNHLNLLWIGLWRSEAHHQHQNMFERRCQTFKRTVDWLMDRTGSLLELWFLCMCCVACVFNCILDPSLDHRQPIFLATG